jgi:hypothetical protein
MQLGGDTRPSFLTAAGSQGLKTMLRLFVGRSVPSRSSVWLCQNVGDAETVRLFGTDTLPTPFGAACPAAVVLAEIQRLNPGEAVELVPVPAGWEHV